MAHGLRGDFAIVGEPTELLPVIAHKGDMYIEVVTTGVEAPAAGQVRRLHCKAGDLVTAGALLVELEP